MTTSMPWIKLYTEMLDDPKIGLLSVELRWRFVELLLLAGECDEDGLLLISEKPMTVPDMAWRLRADEQVLGTELEELQQAGLIDFKDSTWYIVKFSERQGRPQKEKREQWREAQQRHRDKADDVIDDTSISHAPREEEIREEKEERRGESEEISTVQRAAEELTGLLLCANDVPIVNQWEREGVIADDIRDALAWRKDNNRPPVKSIAQLAGGVATARSKRVQGKAARASPVRDYTAGLPDYSEDEEADAPTLSPAPEFAKTWTSFRDTIPKSTQVYAEQVAPMRAENGSIVFVATTSQVAEWCTSRWKAVLETQFMHPVIFEVEGS